MPLVRVWYNPATFHEVDNLRIACEEVVPGSLHTPKGQLTPGSIEFLAQKSQPGDRLTVDAFVDVEAMIYTDREPAQGRSDLIKAALNALFPGKTFAIWVKLVNAGWSSDVHDADSDADMAYLSAVERARFLLDKIRTTS